MSIDNCEPMGYGEFSKAIDSIDAPMTRQVLQPHKHVIHSSRPMGILRNGRMVKTSKPNQGWVSA